MKSYISLLLSALGRLDDRFTRYIIVFIHLMCTKKRQFRSALRENMLQVFLPPALADSSTLWDPARVKKAPCAPLTICILLSEGCTLSVGPGRCGADLVILWSPCRLAFLSLGSCVLSQTLNDGDNNEAILYHIPPCPIKLTLLSQFSRYLSSEVPSLPRLTCQTSRISVPTNPFLQPASSVASCLVTILIIPSLRLNVRSHK